VSSQPYDARTSPLVITLPEWLGARIAEAPACRTDEERVRFTIGLADENVTRGTGGPFGSAVFDDATGRLVAAGVNLVEPARNAVLHAEVVALMYAQRVVGSYTLASATTAHVLATSCAPCAMCLGTIHWSGVSTVLIGATREDATAIGFDEGPVFPESLRYLEARGIVFRTGIARAEGRAVLERYRSLGRPLYNG
jgi:tRNA(Arg) A34 adenosine deaminase TadA